MTYEDYARKIKEKNGTIISTSSLSHKLARESISFKEVIDIAETLGYDVVFKPRANWED